MATNMDKQVKLVLDSLIAFAAPKGFSPTERAKIAKKAGLSPATLRAMSWRRTVNADSLIRLLIARGMSAQSLSNLPQTEFSPVKESEIQWFKIGQELTSEKKMAFIQLIKFLQNQWDLKK